MGRKSERKLLLACMLFVFACVILSGGWRLVAANAQEAPLPVRSYAQIRAVLSAAPAQPSQTVSPVRRDAGMQRMHIAPAPENRTLNLSVASDSNGNVLAGGTYMRAVYQAFTLDDGFV
ncbi:MAG: hypothetical protein IKU38_08395 [Clostridia bacterium]|nr:hypothetical protein [Clostridia bacterium]